MPRKARVVEPGLPHHVIQRGNRNMPVFFQSGDYIFYLSMLAEQAKKEGVTFWSWCLMSNYVHFILVPEREESLARMFREAHRRYKAFINKFDVRAEPLWQERFSSFVMDEPHALMGARYVENNPVAAGLVDHAGDYAWSSARYHLGLRKVDPLLLPCDPLTGMVADWGAYINERSSQRDEDVKLLMKHEKSGLPLCVEYHKSYAISGNR